MTGTLQDYLYIYIYIYIYIYENISLNFSENDKVFTKKLLKD